MTTGYWDRLCGCWPYPWNPGGRTLVAAYTGSHYGMYIPPSDPGSIDDVDMMLVLQPPRRYVYGLDRWEHWSPVAGTMDELDAVAYSVHRFAELLLKGNPNVIGMLWMEHAGQELPLHPLYKEWLAARGAFLSHRVLESFAGYAADQLRRLSHPNHKGRVGPQRKEQFSGSV